MDEKRVNRRSGAERRLQAKIAKIDPDDEPVAWAQAWVSRDGRLNPVFGARHLDYCVVGRHDFYLFSTGFFTRRPRRRVYSAPLDRLTVAVRKGGQPPRLRLLRDHQALRLDLRRGSRSQQFADALMQATEPPPPGPETADPWPS